MGTQHLQADDVIEGEDLMDRTLRYMRQNLEGARAARKQNGAYCTNSGTGVLVCCYINALGKVLDKGQHTGRTKNKDRIRFNLFVKKCMTHFLESKSTAKLPPVRAGGPTGDGTRWLYEVYRCGFVHEFFPKRAQFARRPKTSRYWLGNYNPPMLNIDHLVRGFYEGVAKFKELAKDDPDLRIHFKRYITAD